MFCVLHHLEKLHPNSLQFIFITLALFLSPNQYSAEHLYHLSCFTSYFYWLKLVQHLFSVTAQCGWFIFNLSFAVCSRACSIPLCLPTQYSLINSHIQTFYFSFLQESFHIALYIIFFYWLLLIFLCEIAWCFRIHRGTGCKIQLSLTDLSIPASCPASFILTQTTYSLYCNFKDWWVISECESLLLLEQMHQIMHPHKSPTG